MKLSHKVASIALTSAAALTLAVSAQVAQADTYNGSEVTGHWTDAHGVAGYHVAGQADLVNDRGTWYQNGQEISVDGIIPGYHATETAPAQPAPSQPAVQQPAPVQPAPQAPAQPAPAAPSTPTPSKPTPSKPKAYVPTAKPNQHVEADSTDKHHELHQTDTTHGVQQLATTPDDTSKIIYPVEEGKAHAAANPNYKDENHITGNQITGDHSTQGKYSDTHSVLPQTGAGRTIGLVVMGIAVAFSALASAWYINKGRYSRARHSRK